MTSCRGILIAGARNVARTQMAEAILRSLTHSRLFILSGGVRYDGKISVFAANVLREWNIEINSQSVSSLEAAQRQAATYDVYVSIDAPYHNNNNNNNYCTSHQYQKRKSYNNSNIYLNKPTKQTESHQNKELDNQDGAELSSSNDIVKIKSNCSNINDNNSNNIKITKEANTNCTDGLSSMLAPSMPSHWHIAQDTTDVRQKWQLWSPRNPAIFHETSTRKFQDHLYEGEPLFMQFTDSELRKRCKINERWEVEEVDTRYAMERVYEQRIRFIKARDQIAQLSLKLLHRLEKFYCEQMIVNEALAEKIELLWRNDNNKQIEKIGLISS